MSVFSNNVIANHSFQNPF